MFLHVVAVEMSSVEEKARPWDAGNARTLIEEMKLLGEFKSQPGIPSFLLAIFLGA